MTSRYRRYVAKAWRNDEYLIKFVLGLFPGIDCGAAIISGCITNRIKFVDVILRAGAVDVDIVHHYKP